MKLLIAENIATLQQGYKLLDSIDDGLYRLSLSGFFNASIGGQVRHILDHYRLFLDGLDSGRIDYENRQRDPLLEVDREAAMSEILDIRHQLNGIVVADNDKAVCVRDMTGTEYAWATTSVLRELDFLQNHAVHHFAIIAIICRLKDVDIEATFGVANSTLRYQHARKKSCAH